MLVKLAEAPITTEVTTFLETVYTDGKDTAIALSLGNISEADPLLLRIHSDCLSSHVFFYTGCDCRQQMYRAQEILAANGSGMIVWLDQEGRGNGHTAKVASEQWKARGMTQADAYLAAGYKADAREYGLAVKIIHSHSPKGIRLLTSNPNKAAAIRSLNVPFSSEAI
ncbi:hypothetical protein [Rhizobium sp. ZPR3]|uniref:GTP cyclohydrolase II domain-containing protein n=2 Tax=unclassified Rhizobium TaxID=2613769 RepID=A0AAU7SFC5_9HYPH